MIAVQEVKVFLNNAFKPTRIPVELDGDAPLPEVMRDMPDVVTGRFADLDPATAQQIAAAWKKVLFLNATEVLYTFTFEPETSRFAARKR
jgi:hypothetical protein